MVEKLGQQKEFLENLLPDIGACRFKSQLFPYLVMGDAFGDEESGEVADDDSATALFCRRRPTKKNQTPRKVVVITFRLLSQRRLA